MSLLQIEQMMWPDEIENSGVTKLTQQEQQQLLQWGLRMYTLGQHHVGNIQEIKYGGRVVILDDGSRWEVDEYDAITVELWGIFEKVIVIDNEMYHLDKKISVQKDNI